MPTFEVDDQLHSHPKVDVAGLEAMGLWVVAGSWCAAYLTDGFVPRGRAHKFGDVSLWDRLVKAQLVESTDEGYQFHDWDHWNRTAQQVAERRAKSTAKKQDQRAKKRALAKCTPKCPQGTGMGTHEGTDPETDLGSPCAPRARVSPSPSPSHVRSYGTGETDPVPPSQPPANAVEEPERFRLTSSKPKRQRAKQAELRPKTPIGQAWKTWRGMYQSSRRKYGKYVESGDCKGAMIKVAERALSEAISELQSRGTPGDPTDPLVQEVLEHWFMCYLRDNGRDGFLVDNRHAIRFILKSLTAYGTPWSRDAAASDPAKAQAEYQRRRQEVFGGAA